MLATVREAVRRLVILCLVAFVLYGAYGIIFNPAHGEYQDRLEMCAEQMEGTAYHFPDFNPRECFISYDHWKRNQRLIKEAEKARASQSPP